MGLPRKDSFRSSFSGATFRSSLFARPLVPRVWLLRRHSCTSLGHKKRNKKHFFVLLSMVYLRVVCLHFYCCFENGCFTISSCRLFNNEDILKFFNTTFHSFISPMSFLKSYFLKACVRYHFF